MSNRKSNTRDKILILFAWLLAVSMLFIVYWKIKILINR